MIFDRLESRKDHSAMKRQIGMALLATALLATTAASATAKGVVGAGGDAPAHAAAKAQAAKPHWIPYHQQDFSIPEGEACRLRVRVEVIRDREFYKNVSRYPNGKVRTQLWRGPLVMRFINTHTGNHLR
jgi:hypothetical protein